MNCDCVERINKKLSEAGHEHELAPSLVFDEKMKMEVLLTVPTRWRGDVPKAQKRKSPPTMICTYCPFCRRKTKGNQK